MRGQQPKGMRVLVVEDKLLVALDIAALLEDIGCVVVGPVGTQSAALSMARNEPLDAAILDVNLEAGSIEPVAAELVRRQIPFAFATGYVRADLSPPFRDRPVLEKPFTAQEVEAAMWTLCRGA